MATIPPVNMGALKVTFPANLPRNEKDLICMLLAGRLKDLWNGKLICAQLALDDLIKSTTGVSGLETLRSALISAKGSLDKFKKASGYDKILNGVNKALGQVSNVFSLGGLCPSPVTAPKIPDVLAQLNQNLFGQANGILNALAMASNPKVCLGGGPKGFGIDWNNVTGDLKNLRNAINQFKQNPANYQNTIKAFEANIKSQGRRLNSELKRLEKNVTDPLGINEKKATAGNIQRAKAVSDGFSVKDKNGVVHKNPLRSMLTGEIDTVIARTDSLFASPVKYQTFPVYDYCGVLVGYERKILTGDADYMGWDTVFTDNNTSPGSVLPSATVAQYDYSIIEEQGQLKIYDTTGVETTISLTRGQHYRIKVELSSIAFNILNNGQAWSSGIKATANPLYGSGVEVITADATTMFDNKFIELDWAVQIVNPTTPNSLMISASNGQQLLITVSGTTSLVEADKTYDLSNAAYKALLFTVTLPFALDTGYVLTDYTIKTRKYSVTSVAQGLYSFNTTSTARWNNGYTVEEDTETLDEYGAAIEGNKILKFVQAVNGKFLVSKLYLNEASGMDIKQYVAYLTDDLTTEDTAELLATYHYDTSVDLPNDSRLPFKDSREYMLTLADGIKLVNTDEIKVIKLSANSLKWSLTSSTVPLTAGEFMFDIVISVSPTDIDRSYRNTNPLLKSITAKFKGTNFSFEQTISFFI
jgi:hypothetical protein